MTDKTDLIAAAEKLYDSWADAFAKADIEALIKLYAHDVVVESPLVSVLLKSEEGIVRGRDNVRSFLLKILEKSGGLADRYRINFYTNGKTMIWEYPRITPTGRQTEMAEVMEIEDGLIKAHRIYWGWESARNLYSAGYNG